MISKICQFFKKNLKGINDTFVCNFTFQIITKKVADRLINALVKPLGLESLNHC